MREYRVAAFRILKFSAQIKTLVEDPQHGFPEPVVSFLQGIKDDPEYQHVIRWVAVKLTQDAKKNFKNRKSQMWEAGTAKEELPQEIDFRVDSEYMRDHQFFYKIKAISDWAKENKVNIGGYSIEQAVEHARQWQQQLGQQAASQEAQLDALRQRLGSKEYIGEGIYIIPIRPLEYINTPENFETLREECQREGDELNHCVATYAEQLAEKTTDLYSVRLDSGERVGTIEIQNGKVEQIKGYNDGPLPDEVHPSVRSWLEKHNLQLSSEGQRDIVNIYSSEEARKDLFSGDATAASAALRHPDITSGDIDKLYGESEDLTNYVPSLHPKVIAQVARHPETEGDIINNILKNFGDDDNIALGLALYPAEKAAKWTEGGPGGGGGKGAIEFYKHLFQNPNKRVSEAAKKSLLKMSLHSPYDAREIAQTIGLDSLKNMAAQEDSRSEEMDALVYLGDDEIDDILFQRIDKIIANRFVDRSVRNYMNRGGEGVNFSSEQWKVIFDNMSKYLGGGGVQLASYIPKEVLMDFLSFHEGRMSTTLLENLLARNDLDGPALHIILKALVEARNADELGPKALKNPNVSPQTWQMVSEAKPEWLAETQNTPPEFLKLVWDKRAEHSNSYDILRGLIKNKNTPDETMNEVLDEFKAIDFKIPSPQYGEWLVTAAGLAFNSGLSDENKQKAFEIIPVDNSAFLSTVLDIIKSNAMYRHPSSIVVHDNIESISDLFNKFLEANVGKLTPIKMKFIKNKISSIVEEIDRSGASGDKWLRILSESVNPRFKGFFQPSQLNQRRAYKVAAYSRKISSVQGKHDLAIEETMARYALYPGSLLQLVPNEDTEFREQFDELVPASVVNSLQGMTERTQALSEGLLNYQDNPDWIEKSFYEIQDYYPKIMTDLPKVERQLNRFRNTDFYPKYIISAVTKLLSSLKWLKQWLFQVFQFLNKVIE